MPTDKLTVHFYGPDKKLQEGEVTMSFGLLSVLARLAGDINRIGVLDLDPVLADEVLDEVMIPRTANGKRNPPAGYEMPDLPMEDAHAIFSWVKDHIMDFFLRRLTDTSELMGRNQEKMTAIGSYLGSSKA